MANENTTGSEPTTETTPATTDANPAPASTDTSTTETPNPTPEGEGEGTLLTPKAEGETETTETKPEKTAEETAAEEARAALYGAPEGDYTMPEMPEGMTVDQEALAAATPIAKELNLSDAGFAKLVDVYAKDIVPKVQDRIVENLEKDISAQHAQWASDSMEMLQTDEMFKGQKLEDVQQVAAKALDRFGGTEIREFLQTTGLGNHPSFLKAFYQIGTAISEDTTFERGGSAAVPKKDTEIFYGPQT